MSTVLTVGTFDLFHAGHVFLLEQSKKIAGDGDLVVGINTDEFVAQFKKPPVQTYSERATVVGACRYVDSVITNDSASLEHMMVHQRPNFLTIGQDWALRDYYAQIGVTQEWLNKHGISLLYIPRPDGTLSSTEVKRRVVENVPPFRS